MKRMNQTTMRRLISIGMLLILILLFTILAGAGKGKFLNFDNLIEVVRDASIPTIIGVGVTYMIITAGIDLSTGSMMALVGMTMANIYAYTLLPFSVMIIAGLIVGLLCGLFNGIIVGAELTVLFLESFWLNCLWVAAGEAVVCCVLGYPLGLGLQRSSIFRRLLHTEEKQ